MVPKRALLGDCSNGGSAPQSVDSLGWTEEEGRIETSCAQEMGTALASFVGGALWRQNHVSRGYET